MEKWKKLYDSVQLLLYRSTILVFLLWFYDHISSYLEKPKTSLPGMVLMAISFIEASYYWVDSAMVFLLWLLKYHSQAAFESDYGLPHTSAGEIINFGIEQVSLIFKSFPISVFKILASIPCPI